MAKRLVLVGKIGPKFDGASIESRGGVKTTNGTLGLLFSVMAGNMDEGCMYLHDTYMDNNYTMSTIHWRD